MKIQNCCHNASGGDSRQSASHKRRGFEFAGWVVPSAILALLPKCPVCVAMYVALFSGVGISLTSAAFLRTSLLIVCAAALFSLALHRIYRLTLAKTPFNSHEFAYSIEREKPLLIVRKK